VADQAWEGFKAAYDEPLLFLKHQDDKINRVLTALAFLTAAGVTLYIFSRAGAPPDFPHFSNSYVSVDDYFFGCFLIGLFFAVSLSIVALDPTSFTPRFVDTPDEPSPEKPGSVLFYRSIAAWEKSDWVGLGKEKFDVMLANSFHEDTHRLAHRAVHKVRRFGQANAFVQFTIVSLVLLGLMRLNHLHEADRWTAATTLLIAYTLLPAVDFVYFRALNFPGVGVDYSAAGRNRRETRLMWTKAAAFFLPVFVVSTLGLALAHSNWQPVTFALFATVLLRLLALFQWRRMDRHQWVIPVVASLILATGGALWLWGCR
jgi:hypothetical protein